MKKYIYLLRAFEVLMMLKEGQRIEGSLAMKDGKIVFNPYFKKSRLPGYKAPSTTLYETSNGRLVETSLRYKVMVSIKKAIGRQRTASAMMMQTHEMTEYLKNTTSIAERGVDLKH